MISYERGTPVPARARVEEGGCVDRVMDGPASDRVLGGPASGGKGSKGRPGHHSGRERERESERELPANKARRGVEAISCEDTPVMSEVPL